MVFYRKYRPQIIEELDSKEVRNRLYTVLGGKEISHALLFTGPKGLGKTSTARIVAKVINCEVSRGVRVSRVPRGDPNFSPGGTRSTRGTSSIEPCNKCDQCLSITNGTNMDVLEIDGASNRGIDEIRDLREKVKLSPASARKKVYIIDEVHMLTTEAFNALLKTLEEPPSHVVFILCTTEPHKVPKTIVSRCLHIQFGKAGAEELIRSFERIIKGEELKADKKALGLIASLSDGSFRDGAKILEEITYSLGFGPAKDKKITTELVEQKYKISSIEYQIAQLIRYLEEKDTKNALGVVAKLVEDGVEMGHFMQELISTLHNSLLLKAGVKNKEKFKIQNLRLDLEAMKKLIELLSKANSELKYAILPQLPLELAIVEWGIQKTLPDRQAGQNAQYVRESDDQKVRNSESPTLRKSGAPSFPSIPKTIAVAQQDITGYSENGALWTALIDKVKAYNHSIAGVLRGCRIKSYDGIILLLETNFQFHRDRLSEPKTFEILETAVKEIAKKNIKIEVLLKKPA